RTLLYKFDNNSPLYMLLYKQLKNDIETKLKAGSKLPSIRKLSNDYNLSITTVQNSYNQLYAEGYIESKKNSDYFICED
ncbi:GntR family transcriptional regulator, partial [Aliarcobacter butzleri]|uniref:GntR family transcriptional regulator n=1 Tax=Aliarcobacter butzleri TaxID=28197 RepID=UPI003AF82994